MTELYVEGYGQLSAISALLGGLAFAAAASLLAGAGTSDRADALEPAAKITVISSLASAVLLVLAALAWSFMAADTARVVAGGALDELAEVHAFNPVPSLSLMAGLLLFFAGIGASGWIASPRTGWVTTALAIAGTAGAMALVARFAN